MITLLLIFVPLAAAVLAYSAKNMRKVIRLILLAGSGASFHADTACVHDAGYRKN